MRFVDSHLHLGEEEAGPVLLAAAATQTLLVACGTDRRTSLEALRLAELNPGQVKAFVGVHPSEAKETKGLAWLGRSAAGAWGIGEIGLDPTYSAVGPKSAQMRLFLAQVEMAQKAGKPLQVHSREAERVAVDALGGFRLRSVLMHWFENEEFLPEVLKRGYFVSFGPAVLYSRKLQRMASRSSPDQVLTESDSPVAYRPLGGVHGPSLVPSVVFKLSQLWGVRFEDAMGTVAAGAARFLGAPEKG